MSTKILIIGAGELGTALYKILSNKSSSVVLWNRTPKKDTTKRPLSEVVETAEVILLTVPSWAIREVAEAIAPHLKDSTLVVSMAKGLEEKHGITMDKVLYQTLGRQQPIAVIGGPMIAEEIREGLSGFAALATKEHKHFDKLNKLFDNTSLAFEYSTDLRGVALCGALKNIYAIALGISDGLDLGSNFKGQLVTQGFTEMLTINEKLGGKRQTTLGPAGLGDLIATGFSKNSLNHELGRQVALNNKEDMKSEGSVSLVPLLKLLGEDTKKLHLLKALYKVIIEHKNTRKIFQKLAKI